MAQNATSTPGEQTPLTRALRTIRTLREQLEKQQSRQPIAVIGAGLRLPGGIHTLGAYWEAMAAGRDLVGPMPAEREGPFAGDWAGLPRRGGFLDGDVLDFDAEFFGISPREARHLDPQHRLLLEVTWEALENAGIPATALGGSSAGMYLGVMWQDYRDWLEGEPDAYATTGNGHSFAAGRVAYALGLRGPAVAVDTACSSSLVAVHLAVQALNRGECDIAFAAGVNLILSPRSMRLVQQTRSLAPDGLCKTFDARANGFVRGEGCGAVLLKRLDHALRDGDRIHAVLHGTAVNQDGRSGGFTAPNVLSQVSLIETALDTAGLEPKDIGYVEAHGTGTALGDPIELEALATALGRRNGEAPLPVGAVKTNFGHLEGAAGVAGLIKAVLCVDRRQIPPLVNFRTLNPRIDLSGTGVTVPERLLDWPAGAGRYAGVSSFGMSGTNAHVVLGPAPERTAAAVAPVTGFDISARTATALRELAAQYADHLAAANGRGEPTAYPAFARTATDGRSRLPVSAHITAVDATTAQAALRALAADEPHPAVGPGRTGPADSGTTGTSGAPDDAEARTAVPPRPVVDLPSYPWQRQRYAPARPSSASAGPAGDGLPVAHEVGWVTAEPGVAELDARFVVAGDDDDMRGLLVAEAAARGQRGTVLAPAPVSVPEGWACGPLPAGAAEWAEFWATTAGAAPTSVLLAPAAPAVPGTLTEAAGIPEALAATARVCAAVTSAVSALAEAGGPHRVYVLTTGVLRIDAAERTALTGHGPLHGLAPVLGLELGSAWGGVVDLPAIPTPEDARTALDFTAAQTRSAARTGAVLEDTAAVRAGVVRVPRLRTAPGHHPQLPVRGDATYVVTGGLGAVGRELTGELAERGARHLLLVGRRAEADLTAEGTALLARLRATGVAVRYQGGGADTPGALATIDAALAGMPAVAGVVHAAGSLRQSPATDVTAEDFTAALGAKAGAAWWLHLAFADRPLDFFVLVSSVSALWGTEGCAAYSAANGALDALAAHRAGLGLPAVSLAYGPWALAGAGMADDASRERFKRLGVGALSPAAGRAALTATADSTAGHIVACPLDLTRLAGVLSELRPRGLFAGAAGSPRSTSPANGGVDQSATRSEPSVRAELAALPPKALPDAVRSHVLRLVAAQLGHTDAAAIRADVGLLDLGLDSIMAVDLTARLSGAFGTQVLAADVFDLPTVDDLAGHLLQRLLEDRTDSTPDDGRTRALPPGDPIGERADAGLTHEAPALTAPTPLPPSGGGQPIAIVGMAGRFPGADSVAELWELLREGRDGVTTVPEGRWDRTVFHTGAAGDPASGSARITTDQGGFLAGIDLFDAAFFDIPAREAQHLDPQQRLLLESSWHALEDARIDPRTLHGSRTGVFAGISYADYARLLARGGPERVDAYYSTGTALNAAVGRIAFTLGLRGPAMAVDTACSSSLTALHLAIRSLRSGETDLVLTGGVNVLLDPLSSVAVSRAHMLSPDGRCRAFSAGANGFVRSEACGVLVLKRWEDARRDGDRVLALVLGSAVGQDGASPGLTAPNGRAQEEMLAAALADAGVAGSQVSYLEAHGTGTALGDPVELRAAWRVLGPGRDPGTPLRVGSVKSNVGHCESAAGVVGVIKTVLALRHGVIPANLHFDTPNPLVPWEDMNLRVVDAPLAWPARDEPRVAGVSGFGFTGTNAHVVLAEVPGGDRPAPPDGDEPLLVPLSAPDAAALERLGDAWERWLTEAPERTVAPAAATAGAGRAHLAYRRALLGRDRTQLLKALRDAPPPAGPVRAPRVAFLFSGQGSQYYGMGRELYETEPVYREVFDACDRVLAPALGASLAELTLYGADRTRLDDTRVTQPALVTLELALVALWESWGVTPVAVMGHSVGEITAAMYAGVLDRAAGLELIAHRAGLMQRTRRGAMLAVAAPEGKVLEWIAGHDVDVAAVNGPGATVVSGAPDAISGITTALKERGIRVSPLRVSHAFHSRLLDPVLPELTERLRRMDFRAPELPLVSNVTGQLAGPGTYDAEYWSRHARGPVRFHDGMRQLAELDIDVCLEIGPDRTLVNLVQSGGLLPAEGLTASLRRGATDRLSLLTAAKSLYEHGQDLVWDRVYPPHSRPRGDAPHYPFARTRHWTPLAAPADPAPTPGPGPSPAAPTWGTELRSPALRGRVFTTERSTAYPRHLTDHRLFGTVSVPGASQAAAVLSALGTGSTPVTLEDLHFPRALVLHDGERYELQLIDAREDDGSRTVSVQSLVDPDHDHWQEHLAARVAVDRPAEDRRPPDRATFAAAATRRLSGSGFYRHLHSLGYHLGPSFRWIAEAWIHGDDALIRFAQPEQMNEDPAGYEIHPGLLDSCLQSAVVFAVGEGDAVVEADELAVPFAAERLAFPGRPGGERELWGHVRAVRQRGSGDFRQVMSADLHLFDAVGRTVLTVDGFRFRSAPRALLQRSLRRGVPHAYDLTWVPDGSAAGDAVEPDGAHDGLRVALLGAEEHTGRAVRTVLTRLGHRVAAATERDLAGLATDLVLDARFCAPPAAEPDGTGSLADGALTAAWQLTEALRAVPADIPYAVLAAAEEADAAPVRDALFGLVASLAAEQPGRRLLRIILADDWDGTALAGVLTRPAVSGQAGAVVRVGAGTVHTAQLVPHRADDDLAETGAGTTGAALITGGLGALGLSSAAFLARRGVRAITLMARSAPDATARAVLAELAADGVRVEVVRGDVTDPGACRTAVATAARHAPLRTVLHLAGAVDDHAFERQTRASFEAVFAPKARGAMELHRALRDHRLDAFVLYSSASAVLGSPGQTNYAAANGFLAGLAEWLRSRGTPAVSVDWGPWVPRSGGGLAADGAARRPSDRRGIRPLADPEAEDLFGLTLRGRQSRIVAVALDPGVAGHPVTTLHAPPARRRAAAGTAPERGWLRAALDALALPDRQDLLLRTLRSMTREVLGDDEPVDPELGFSDLGVDSIMAIDLRDRLVRALGLDLPATVAFDHPSVSRLAGFALGQLYPVPDGDRPARPRPEPSEAGDVLGDLSFDELLSTVQADVSADAAGER